MWVLISRTFWRWVLITLAVPLVAGGLSFVGRKLQERKGHPTKPSKTLLATSGFLRRRTRKDTTHEAGT
jgi:hypothetical protein